MTIGIISYGAGNVASVQNALDRLGVKSLISSDRKTLEQCDKLIFPGVGHATHAMENLSRKGLDKLLQDYNRPVLGICLGMQLMGSESEEGPTKGLGLIDFRVKRFEISEKVPHMGWNSIEVNDNPLFEGIANGTHFYFVHGYYAELSKETIASSEYEIPFSVAVASGNYFGVQFHPEKSGPAGAKILENFVKL
jgi:imidazole glycerol-phosphate synthase subunit HisH